MILADIEKLFWHSQLRTHSLSAERWFGNESSWSRKKGVFARISPASTNFKPQKERGNRDERGL